MRLATVLRELRARQGLTQEQLAQRANVTQAYVTHLERGIRKNPSLVVLKRLAKALGVPVAELLG